MKNVFLFLVICIYMLCVNFDVEKDKKKLLWKDLQRSIVNNGFC